MASEYNNIKDKNGDLTLRSGLSAGIMSRY